MSGGVRPLRWAWAGALACFALAGLTGAGFRWALALGDTGGFDLTNVRHAHSHLMYFGWGTPALMALVALNLPARTGRPLSRAWAWTLAATFACALVSYPLFLAFGYSPAVIGGNRLPLTVIASGLNVFAWYAFIALYARATRGVARDLALRCWDLALAALVVATGGAWGLAALKPLGIENAALAAALTHVFLDLFSAGWFVLGVLGLAAAAADRVRGGAWGVWLVAAGVPFTFALSLPPALVPPLFRGLATAGAGLAGAGLLAVAWSLWSGARGRLWRVALVCLALKAGAEVMVGLGPGRGWVDAPGMRILYLHLMLLGWVTLGLVAAARDAWGVAAAHGRTALALAVVALLGSLVPISAAWPAAWGGRWVYVLAAVLALGPALIALRMLVPNVSSPRSDLP